MKKLITIFSFLILTSTVFANSVGGSIGGWQVVSNVASGIGSKLTATKDVMINGASKTLSATANITPNPTNVAKFLAKAGTLSLAIDAMNQLLDGVDYVMDPANNTLTYKNKPADPNSQCNSDNPCSSSPTLFYSSGRPEFGYFSNIGSAGVVFAQNVYGEWFKNITYSRSTFDGQTYFVYLNGTEKGNQVNDVIVYVNAKSNPYYDPSATDDNKPITVPLSNIGSQVIDQAEKDIRAGNPTSPAVALSRAVAQDMVVEAQTDDVKARPIVQQLEQNQTYPTTEDATGTIDTPAVTDPITGEVVKPAETSDIQMKFPKACEWFPQLCVFIDWMQKDPELDEDLDVPKEEKAKKEINENLVKISSSTCPAPYPVEINLPVLKTTYTDSIDISPYCPEIEKLAPVLQLLAFVLAVMIIKDI